MKMKMKIIVGLFLIPATSVGAYISTTSSAQYQKTNLKVHSKSISNGNDIIFNGSLFERSENIDALIFLDNDLLISSSTDSDIGGNHYLDGDIIRYNPHTGVDSLFISESVFGGKNEDIDAAHMFDSHVMALSTTSSAQINGGLKFKSGDILKWNLATDEQEILFKGKDYFERAENIDALSFLNGDLLISSSTDGATLSGLDFLDGDILRLRDGELGIYMSESIFTGNEDINALHATPIPPALWLFCSGLIFIFRGKFCNS